VGRIENMDWEKIKSFQIANDEDDNFLDMVHDLLKVNDQFLNWAIEIIYNEGCPYQDDCANEAIENMEPMVNEGYE